MLYLVRINVNLPHDMSVAQTDDIKAPENAYAQQLQQEGKKASKWQQLYCVVGQYANYSILDVESNEALHTLLSALPLASRT